MAQAATAQAITNQTPPVTGTESLQDVLGRLGRESSSMRSAEAAGATQFASKMAGATQKLAAAEKEAEELKAPKIEPMPEAPKPVYTDPMQAFGSPAMVLAVLGGMLTQNSLATALNAGAGVMKAQRENDLQAQKYNMDVWKQAVQNATNSNNFELDKYRAAIEKLGTDRSSAIAELNAWSHALVNPQFAAVVASGDDKAILGYFTQMQRSQQMMEEMFGRMQLAAWKPAVLMMKQSDGSTKPVNGEFNALTLGYRTVDGKEIPSDQVDGQAIGPFDAGEFLDQKTMKSVANAYVESGNPTVLQAAGSLWGSNPVALWNRKNLWSNIMETAHDKGMTDAEIGNLAAKFKSTEAAAATVGRVAGSTAQGAQEIQQFVPLIKQLSDSIDRTQYPTLNSIEMAVKRGTGDPNVVALNSYIQSAKNAYVLIMTRSGRSTDSARSRSDELLNLSMPTGQIDAALQAMATEAAVAQSGAARATQEVTGQRITAPAAPQIHAVTPPAGAPADAKKGRDGNWYVPDPKRPGKYLRWEP